MVENQITTTRDFQPVFASKIVKRAPAADITLCNACRHVDGVPSRICTMS